MLSQLIPQYEALAERTQTSAFGLTEAAPAKGVRNQSGNAVLAQIEREAVAQGWKAG